MARLEVRELPELIASLRADHVEKSVRLFAEQEVSDCFVDLLASLREEQLKAYAGAGLAHNAYSA